jgi:hypothetical protein
MEELRRSLLDLQTELSDVRRSQSSLNVLAGGGGAGGAGTAAASARLAGLRQSNQDILRSSRLSLTQSLRQSRDSFSGLSALDKGAVAAALAAGKENDAKSATFGAFAGPTADKAALPFGSPIAAAMPFGSVVSLSPVHAAGDMSAADDESPEARDNSHSFSGDGSGGSSQDNGSQGGGDDDEAMDEEVRQVLEECMAANYAEAEKRVAFEAGPIGMSFEDFSSVAYDASMRP